MRSIHVLHVVGARPNFMKAAPVLSALAGRGVRQTLVHTGQHYDPSMSDVFFRQLDMPRPDVNLDVGSATHAQQTAEVMLRLEPIVLRSVPDLVLVYGDVNSTVAAALVCAKLLIPVGHVEAGLRSFDRSMPEEVNRLLTDQLAELLFTHSREAKDNLLREGVAEGKIHFVGNVMIDTLSLLLPETSERSWTNELSGLAGRPYALVTMHRPSNVDEPAMLREIMDTLVDVSSEIPVIFPLHPRTRQRLHDIGYGSQDHDLFLLEPLGYLDFLALQRRAKVVITDSGGVQEETTFLGVPCLTLRDNTERPVTVNLGTNVLVGRDPKRLRAEVGSVLAGPQKQTQVPPLWDGHAAERIADVIITWWRQK